MTKSYTFRLSILLAGLFSYFLTTAAYALDLTNTSAVTMLINFMQTVPQLMKMVTALAYVMGFAFTYNGLMGLKKFGEMRTMMTSHHELKGPLISLFVGAALIYLPTAVHVGLSTFWTNPAPYAYQNEEQDAWNELLKAVYMIVQLVGTISLIRGLIMLTKSGGHHQASFGKAMTHMIAGILCINIKQFIDAVTTTLGVGTVTTGIPGV